MACQAAALNSAGISIQGAEATSGAYDSGGVGPTHDDVTYEAVATYFNATCAVHAATLERMRTYYSKRGLQLNPARVRMATLPVGSVVHFTHGMDPDWVPLVQMKGVYVLPGIPKLFQAMIVGANKEVCPEPRLLECDEWCAHFSAELATELPWVSSWGNVLSSMPLVAASMGMDIQAMVVFVSLTVVLVSCSVQSAPSARVVRHNYDDEENIFCRTASQASRICQRSCSRRKVKATLQTQSVR
jgi:hypothetical protein